MVYDEAESDLHDLFLARVRCHGERWRLRFLVVSPVQLPGGIARRYQTRRPAGQSPLIPVTIAGAIGGNRLLITEYRLPFPAFPALLPPGLCFLNFGYWLLAIFRATGLGQ
jgi:hypothetical protein